MPFCRHICHYCDFAKTARFSAAAAAAYFEALAHHVQAWLRAFPGPVSTLFVGGGTPSLFDDHYRDVFGAIHAAGLAPNAEVTLEANPLDVTEARLRAWRALGINRLSLGVQSFSATGLRVLTRQHRPDDARAALALAQSVLTHVNVDLIYGWPGQTCAAWERDLQEVTAHRPPHLSLYNLTFEPGTVMGRRYARGVIPARDERDDVTLYTLACQYLAAQGYEHYEVSNWALPGFACQHNADTWAMESYIGVGSGAHGYLALDAVGRRYHYPRHWPSFAQAGIEIDPRDTATALLEHLSCGLRTRQGVLPAALAAVFGRVWRPTATIRRGESEGCLVRDGQRYYLTEGELFREHAWTLAFADGLREGQGGPGA